MKKLTLLFSLWSLTTYGQSVVVSGAGTPGVNGTYFIGPGSTGVAYTYTNASSASLTASSNLAAIRRCSAS